MTHLALARKWRPKQFDDVVGQPFVLQALTNALNQNKLHHAYLFTGTRGVGKTTIARIFAKSLNCEKGVSATPCQECRHCQDIDNGRFPDLFEIDAASRTKVEDTRDILDNVQYAPTSGRYKIYLIDEVHMLSGHSFNALLKTLEEPPAHVKFLLATTDPQKLPATVLSRCLQFHLNHVSIDIIQKQLEKICDAESVTFESAATHAIGKAANGSLRDALSLLDQCIAFSNGQLKPELVNQLLGNIDQNKIDDLLLALANQDADAIIALTNQLNEHGIDFSRALADLLSALHQVTLLQLTSSADANTSLQTIATQITHEDTQLYYQIGLIGQRDLPFAPSAKSGFEMTLLRMLSFTPDRSSTPTTIAAKKPQQAPAASKPQAASPTVDADWQQTYNALTLTGAARMLAEQCSLLKSSDTKIELALDPKHKALLQDSLVARVKQSLTDYLNKPIQLSIKLAATKTETPADAKLRQAQQTQQKAEQAIYNDSKVQDIIKTFDAKIIKESIKPVIQTSGEDE